MPCMAITAINIQFKQSYAGPFRVCMVHFLSCSDRFGETGLEKRLLNAHAAQHGVIFSLAKASPVQRCCARRVLCIDTSAFCQQLPQYAPRPVLARLLVTQHHVVIQGMPAFVAVQYTVHLQQGTGMQGGGAQRSAALSGHCYSLGRYLHP